jgi:hypothetical protein
MYDLQFFFFEVVVVELWDLNSFFYLRDASTTRQ